MLQLPAVASDTPIVAACDALVAVACAVPALCMDATSLLTRSAVQEELPTAQLRALSSIISGVRSWPAECGEMLCTAVVSVSEALVCRAHSLLLSPETLGAFFSLLAASVQPATAAEGAGPCEDTLRRRTLEQTDVMATVLSILGEALPESMSPITTEPMLLLLRHIASKQPGSEGTGPEAAVLQPALPIICPALVQALVAQEHLTEPEGLAIAGEAIIACYMALPEETLVALQLALEEAEVARWSREPFYGHVAGHAAWPRRWEWLEYFQEIVRVWQDERRHRII